MKGQEIVLKAVHYHPTSKRGPKVQEKDGTIGQTAFQNVLRVKIGARAIIIHDVDVLDGITNGQLGVIMDFIKTTVDKIVFKPQDTSIGHNNRYASFIHAENVLYSYSPCAATCIEF